MEMYAAGPVYFPMASPPAPWRRTVILTVGLGLPQAVLLGFALIILWMGL